MSEAAIATQPHPLVLLQGMIDKGADPATLGRMLELAERYEAIQAKKHYVETIANFQAICPVIKKTREVKKRDGTHLYMHTNYEDIKKIIGPYLKQFDIVLSYSFDDLGDGGNAVDGTPLAPRMLGHITVSVGSHSETSSMPLRVPKLINTNEAQDHGGAQAYLRRYLVVGALDLTIEGEDQDGTDLGTALTLQQITTLKEKIADCDEAGHPIDMPKFLATYNAAKLEDINPKIYKDVLNMIGKKLAKATGGGL